MQVLVEFLARFLSLFYMLLGALLLLFARDVRRYATPIRIVAWWCLFSVGVFFWFAVPAVFIVSCLGVFALSVAGQPLMSLIGAGLLACGVPVYLIWRSRLKPAVPAGPAGPAAPTPGSGGFL